MVNIGVIYSKWIGRLSSNWRRIRNTDEDLASKSETSFNFKKRTLALFKKTMQAGINQNNVSLVQ